MRPTSSLAPAGASEASGRPSCCRSSAAVAQGARVRFVPDAGRTALVGLPPELHAFSGCADVDRACVVSVGALVLDPGSALRSESGAQRGLASVERRGRGVLQGDGAVLFRAGVVELKCSGALGFLVRQDMGELYVVPRTAYRRRLTGEAGCLCRTPEEHGTEKRCGRCGNGYSSGCPVHFVFPPLVLSCVRPEPEHMWPDALRGGEVRDSL